MTIDQQILLDNVKAASEALAAAHARALEAVAKATQENRAARAQAIRAADDAGVPRELIAAAAGLSWPVSRQRWSQLRNG